MRLLWLEMACVVSVAVTTVAMGQSDISTKRSASGPSSSQIDSEASSDGGPASTAALPDAPSAEDPRKENKLSNLPLSLIHEQFGMWTSPGRARLSDATWLVPLGGFA